MYFGFFTFMYNSDTIVLLIHGTTLYTDLFCGIFSMRCIRRMNRAISVMSVHFFGTVMHCDHTVHFSVDLSLLLDRPMCWAP